jgi:outer membrane protein insertion porin family
MHPILTLWRSGPAVAAFIAAAWVGTASAQDAISEVEIRGELRRVAPSLIRTTLGLSEGVELSQENVQEAIRALQSLNVFEDIQVWGQENPEGVKVIVVVTEYPALEGIRFKGHKELKEKEMKEALGLVIGQVMAPRDIARGRQKILDMYKDKGYLRAEVKGQVFDADEEGKVYLQYDIDEGDKVRIKTVTFTGNEALGDGKLKKQMETKENRWWRKGEFKPEVFEEDKQKLVAYYRSEGYQQAHILRDSVYYDDSRKNLFIDLEVEEGEKYRVGAITWNGNELLDQAELSGHLGLDEGDIFSMPSPQLAYNVKNAYFEKGYLDTEVIPTEITRNDSIDVHFQIYEGEPFKVRRIDIKGNVRTREKVLRREIQLRPGAVYKQSAMQESQRRLYMLGYFKDVQIRDQVSPIEGDRTIDLTFAVEEQRTGAASMGAGYSGRDKLVGTLGLQIPNFRGKGQNLDFSWEFGYRREQFLVGFTEPWLFDTPTSFSFRVYTLKQQYYNDFSFKRNSVSLRVGRRLERPSNSSVSFGYQLRDQKYTNFEDSFDETQRSSGHYAPQTTSSFELSFRRDTRDFPQFPTSGSVLSYTPEVASSWIAGDVDFHRHEVAWNYYRPHWWKFVISLESKFAVVDGFSDWDDENLSFWDRFTPGGVDLWDGQVRGYRDASLGPRKNGINTGGRSMMILNLEYRFPITERQIIGLLFVDAGNSWSTVTALNPTDLKRSIGLGFRVMTPMLGMIGFDFAYGFDRRSVDGERPGLQTHFQFGPRFF